MPVNKVRRRGSYAPLSAHYYKDDKLIRAGEKAELLYVRALAFCADVLNDGFITDAQMAHVGVGLSNIKARAKALVDTGAWQRGTGGYFIVAWLSWNKSREAILEENRKDADRKGPQGSDQPLPPEPPPDDLPESDPWDDTPSEMTPNGIQAESERNSDGGQTESQARRPARAPSNSRAKPEPELFRPLPADTSQAVAAGAATETQKGRAKPRRRDDDPPLFAEFWETWPRKIAKPEGRKKFWAALERGVAPETIVAAAKAQAAQWQRERKEIKFIPHAATWLNQARYEDHVERPDLRVVGGGESGSAGHVSPWADYMRQAR